MNTIPQFYPVEHYRQLKAYFSRYIELSEKELKFFYGALEVKTFPSKELIVRQGELCKYNFFILEGITRSYYHTSEGSEVTTQFALEDWWVTDTFGFFSDKPSFTSIEAIEPIKTLAITKRALENIYSQIPKFERAFRLIYQNMLVAIQQKDAYYMKLTAKEKYEVLMRDLPQLLQRVPQYKIASYIGVSPEYFSEIRKSQ